MAVMDETQRRIAAATDRLWATRREDNQFELPKYPPHDPALPVVAVDFDGTLAKNTWPSPHLGKADLDAIDLVIHYYDSGCEVIVYTARPDSHLERIWEWLDNEGIGDYVYDVTNRKPRAFAYFDDRAIRWPL